MTRLADAATVAELSIETCGYQTRGLRAGEGSDTAVLLLHGGGAGAQATSNWRLTLPVLGERFDTIAPDLVGFGDTTHPEDPPLGPKAWLERRVDQLVGILDALGHEQAVLVGNSLGGALAQHMVVAHPDRVSKLVLMGSGGAPFVPGEPLMRLLRFYEEPTKENLRDILRSFVYDLDGFGDVDALVEARLENALREDVQRSWRAMFTSPDGSPIGELGVGEDAVRAIDKPTLVVHGREDRIIPPDASTWFHERIRLSDLVVLGRCGHWAMLERPEAFNRIVTDFVRTGEV